MRKMTDELLREAAEKSCRAFVEDLESDYDPENAYVPSPSFRRKIRALAWRVDHPWLYRAPLRAAVLLLVCLVGLGTFFSVDANARDSLRNWLREVGDNAIFYRFGGQEKEESFPAYRLTWVPDGYVLEDETDNADAGKYDAFYQDPDSTDCVIFSYRTMSHGVTWIDGEEYTHEYVTVNGCTGEFYETTEEGGGSNLLWFDEEENLLFAIDSNLDRETIFRIAESVSLVKTQ